MSGLARVVAIVGATATGKTALGEAAASLLDGEVVCADSRQLYRELEIGTGKPTPAERAGRPHHLFDLLALGQRASAGSYARVAAEACAAIHARGRVAVLVGGSGLYLEALRHGLSAAPPRDTALRERLARELALAGAEALHARLSAVDPESAARLEPRDAQRVMRALEVHEASGRPLSWWHRHAPRTGLTAEWRLFEIVLAPRDLSRRIVARTRAMFAGGLVEETASLLAAGHEPALTALAAIGYDEAMALIAGRMTHAEAEERTDQRTRQLAKRQRTWFRHRVTATRVDGSEDGGWPTLRRLLDATRRSRC